MWVHDQIGVTTFAWQTGYAAFTVSANSREGVQRYISNQEKHHSTRTFREELVEMLNLVGIAYDPKYLS